MYTPHNHNENGISHGHENQMSSYSVSPKRAAFPAPPAELIAMPATLVQEPQCSGALKHGEGGASHLPGTDFEIPLFQWWRGRQP